MNYYNQIKEELLNNEITKKVKDYSKNKSDLTTYYNVGKLLTEAGKHYGEGIIKNYSIKLTHDLGKGFSKRNLWLMLRFFELKEKMQALSAQLSWSHYCELLSFNDIDKMNYYIDIAINQNLSVRELRAKIKSNEYERLPKETIIKLKNQEKTNIQDFVKNPIIIKNNLNTQVISEKILKQLILEDIPSFLKELGNGFSFVDSEYKIKIGDSFNYIDILLFNYKFNSFIVVELKVTEIKKEHIGQVQVYMNYIDKNVKTIYQDKTIGLIITKKDNKLLLEYSSDPKIFDTTYILQN